MFPTSGPSTAAPAAVSPARRSPSSLGARIKTGVGAERCHRSAFVMGRLPSSCFFHGPWSRYYGSFARHRPFGGLDPRVGSAAASSIALPATSSRTRAS